MSKITVDQSLAIASVLALATQAGKEIEDMTIKYLEDNYPEEAIESVLIMLTTLTETLKRGESEFTRSNPLESVLDGIVRGFKE